MRKRYLFPAIILFFSVLGGYTSRYFTGSQPQFVSLNEVFLCLAALVSAGCLASEFFSKKKAADSSELSGRFSLLSVVGIAFVAAGWISSATSGRFWSALFGMPASLVGMLTITAITVIGWYTVRHREVVTEVMSLAAPVVLFATAAVAFIIPIINFADKYRIDAEHLGFGNSSELGLLFVVLSVFTLNLRYPLLKKRFNLELGLRLVIVLFTLMVMYSSRMYTGIVVIIGILIWFLITQVVTSKKARTALGWGGASAVVVLTAGATYAGLNKLISSEFFDVRAQLWRMAVAILKDRPVLGYGADGFFGGAATVAKPSNWFGGGALHLTDGTTDPHNVLVLAAVSFGLVGLVLLLCWFGLWVAKSLKSTEVKTGYAPAFVASLASAYILLTMPTTVNLLPIVAVCFALSVSVGSQESGVVNESGSKSGKNRKPRKTAPKVEEVDMAPRDRFVFDFKSSGVAIKKIATIVSLCLILFGTADMIGRIALGPVVYMAGTSFERAVALEKVYGFDPYFAHQVNLAYAYSAATGAAAEKQTATFKSLKTESAETGDVTNPYYTLVYANAAYKAGFTKTQRGVAASTANRLHQILLEQAAKTFPKQPDINIELAIAGVIEGDLTTAKTALAVVEEFGTYGQRIWGVPMKEVQSALAKANQ